ncbi:unnamed protein product [marine sediment metagenome]|uniref:Uncharacterized protein n=1 Tax=marine sediment metagenome TaxID=412755 RepID=X1Q1S2_9ZZZZ
MAYRVLRLCAACAAKLKRGEGYLIMRELDYIWRGRKTKGLFCWHEIKRG